MNKKNVAKIAIFLILLTCLIGAVNASEDVSTDTINAADDQTTPQETTHEDTQKEIVSEPTKPVSDDTQKTQTKLKATNKETNNNTNDDDKDTTKTTNKKNDNTLKAQNNQETLKSGTKEVTVNNITELTDAINNAISDNENDTQIIKLNNGEYKATKQLQFNTKSPITKTIIINGNNQIITKTNTYSITFNNIESNIIINNLNIKLTLSNYGNLTLSNSTINSTINHNSGILTIKDDVIFGEKTSINLQNADDQIVINNTNRILPYLNNYYDEYVIENATFSFGGKQNYGYLTIKNSTILSTNGGEFSNNNELTIINSTINAPIRNVNKLTIINSTINKKITNYKYYSPTTVKLTLENVTFGGSFFIDGDDIEIDYTGDMNKILPYLKYYSGDHTLNNITITTEKTNNGNLTLDNVTINAAMTNNGNLTVNNTTINAGISNSKNLTIDNSIINNTITNNGVLILGNNIIIGTNFQISGTGRVITDRENELFPYLSTFYGEGVFSIENYNKNLNNYGNLTLENSTINAAITNNANGQLTFNNCTIKQMITNNENGQLTFNNCTINQMVQNTNANGQLTFNNCTIKGTYTVNKGTAIISNSRIIGKIISWLKLTILNNTSINNTVTIRGELIISEDTIIGENFQIIIQENGQVITNNTNSKLIDYVNIYNGNLELTNKTLNTPKTNKGTLTLTNCTINSTIDNIGRIIFSDDTVFGENAKITGDGSIQITDITKILPIIDAINGDYLIKDTTLNKNYIFDGTVTLSNCTITSQDNINHGTLNLKNCTVDVGADNTFLTNYGIVTVSKDTKITGKILPDEDGVFYEGVPKTYNINSGTIDLYFDETGLNSIIRPGDIFNFQGNIVLSHNLIIDMPVNINSENAYINGNQLYNFTITEDGAYTNITGISFNNTKIIINAKYVTLENTNINGTIKLDGSNNTISNNKIITTDEYTITSTIGQNNTITNNYLVAQKFIGDKTVNLPDTTNIIKDNVPLNLKIEITVTPENTVNKTATIIIVLKDDNDNLIPNQKVNVTIGSKTQEADLKNGFLVYTYTPENIGEDAITIKYAGDNTYLPTTNTSTINITANKDQIIEELNQEILDKNETIHNQEDTIQNQNQEILDKNETITALNNTVKAQNNTIQTQTETIQKQDTTIQTQKQEINTANNKLATAEKQASQATVPIKTVKAAKTVKKSKKYTIKVTLKKAVKGKKVFVIFNGKTYTKKTNKKGIATITIPKSALKKLGGKKIKYQIISGEKIVKKSVKVKK